MARKKRKTMRETNDVVLDHALYLWISQKKKRKGPDIGPSVVRKSTGGSADFNASTGWLKNKSRHGIRELQIEGESLSGDKNSTHKFKETFLNIRIVSGFIYCMDRIRFSVIRTIAYLNGVRSQLIQMNDILLYC
ncbi:jerky-like protein [Trichonephila clavipes]|nr:jerky-like protein [Trichonephila clavipes]